ncbi:MAG: DUF1127 domain-containing protein [Alphaproteobacteria bacterium]|nr:DUF1127 domain-containing protein [Alphaproteobacteria bacterium]
MGSHVLHDAAGFAPGSVASRWTKLSRRIADWRERRRRRAQITRELLSYTDRELFDLGITRGDIPAVINGTYRRS